MNRKYKINTLTSSPYIPKYVNDTYQYLVENKKDSELIVTKDIVKSMSEKLGYSYNSVNQALTTLRSLGFIEMQSKWNKYKRKEHLEFEYGSAGYKKSAYLKCIYGISMKDLQTLYDKQESKCAICDKHESKIGSKLHVDHCHRTGKVRGLLCAKCNKGIGLFNDNEKLMEKAKLYLENSK